MKQFKPRPYQQECLDKLYKEYEKAALSGKFLKNGERMKGRIVLATAGGKTLLEALFLKYVITNNNGFNIHLVIAPTIVLTNQLCKEYRSYIGQDYLGIAFHSGKKEQDYENIDWDEKATTRFDILEKEIERAKNMGKDLVIFSTYHSAHKLLPINFETMICDESQHCVSVDWFKAVSKMKAQIKLFFTATEKHTEKGIKRGLNNKGVYGPVLYGIVPQELIDMGYIAAPLLHVMTAYTNNGNALIDEVIRTGKYHDEHVDTPYSKTLFAMRGTQEVIDIAENCDKIKAQLPNHKIFTIISNKKYQSMIDGERVSREHFMQELRDTDNALVFHYRILAEGIDVDGITGVYLMREMSKTMLLQTIGRALRIPAVSGNTKTTALITCSVIDGDESNKNWLEEILHTLRKGGFEITIEEIKVVDTLGLGEIDEPEIEDAYDSEKLKKSINGILTDVFHELEEREKIDLGKEDIANFENLTPEQQREFMKSQIQKRKIK